MVLSRSLSSSWETVVQLWLQFSIDTKMFHWQAARFSQHTATDQLLTTLLQQLDEFMEIVQGASQQRLSLSTTKQIYLRNMSKPTYEKKLQRFMTWLSTNSLFQRLGPDGTSLLNLRDEVLASCQQMSYLLTFL